MGAALARATQWTSVSESGKGKLEFSPLNEKLLNDIIKVSLCTCTFLKLDRQRHGS